MQKKTIQKKPKNNQGPKSSKLSQAQEDKKEQKKLKNSHQESIIQPPIMSDQTPRFVSCASHDVYNGNLKEYTWDTEKIFVHENLQDDVLMLQNVFEGKIISPLVYPLVFDHKSPQKEITLRSIQFYKEVQEDPSLYYNLSPDEKGYFLIGARDLFIAACRGILTQEEKELLIKIVELIDPNDNSIIFKMINNIEVAPYPTSTHKMVRFLEDESEEGCNALDECFVRNELGFFIGFVDPRDLSFHNFENIMNLDSLFKAGEDFPITNFKEHGEKKVYTFDLEDKNNLLRSLDKYGLYTQPLNKLSRGGERFIFSSKILGDSLTSALEEYVYGDFQFVNYVFRYNKFKPGDKKFTSHFDTPYHDPAQNHYSKYTLLLYLTPGTADPVLSIDNGKLRIDQIENTGCVKGVIFDQKYEHEGRSFVDSDKIFLRSELVYGYSSKELGFDPNVSKKFNIACYMTKQSVFNPELERYASDCFNQVAQARIDLAKAKLTEDILLYKSYCNVPFITNGYDYWFLKETNLKRAAIVTLLDYLGGQHEEVKLKNYAPGVVCSIEDVKDIFKHLKHYASQMKTNTKGKENPKNSKDPMVEEEDKRDDSGLVQNLPSEVGEEQGRDDVEICKTLEKNGWPEDVKAAFKRLKVYLLEKNGWSEDVKALFKNLKDYVSQVKPNTKGKKKTKKSKDPIVEEEDNGNDSDLVESLPSEFGEEQGIGDFDIGEIFEKHGWSLDDECPYCDESNVHPNEGEIEWFLRYNHEEISDNLGGIKDDFSVFIFNQEIKMNKSIIKINKDSIVFDEQIPSVNFASCMFDVSQIGIWNEKELKLTGYANIPPIPYAVHEDGYHLKIELFNNGFVRKEEQTLTKYTI